MSHSYRPETHKLGLTDDKSKLQHDDYIARAGPFCTSRDWSLFWSEVPTRVAILHNLACDSTRKANVTSSHERNVLELGQDITVRVIGDKSLEVLLYRRFTVLLLDKVICVLGAIVTMRR
jgi:hypothetical protein